MTRVLHLEDSSLDQKLVASRLEADGLELSIRHVDTEAAFRQAISARGIDLILADFNLPQFSGMTALSIALEAMPDVPFIVVSGALGEQTAIDVIKAGATDFVLKDHLHRLAPAVRRAMREAADRDARRRAEAEVREARDIAEAANRAKDHFLAVLSHELRTPLTPALTAIQTMECDPALPAEFREPVAMIRRNVQLEVKLIDDLLDLTRVSRGKLDLTLQPVDAHESIRHVLAICETDVRDKQLEIVTELNAGARLVSADPARLQQIFWNLVKNAIKFTPPGGKIDIRTWNEPDGRFALAVTDTGVGIEPEIVAKIFDAFEQGGKEITRQFGGLGLGLAISRALTEMHGGALEAWSEGRAKGARFTLRLAAKPAAVVAPPTPVRPAADDLAGCRVLLVDDHIDTARAMGRLLKRWGCVVETADSVRSALKVADGSKFDVLISDIGLPDGTGLDLIRQLQKRHSVRGIAVSGFGMEEDLNSSRSAGFLEHLVKPVDLSKLEAAIRRVVKLK
jgi:signal transduction histidine kinase